MIVLAHVGWFLVMWALSYSVLMVLAILTAGIFGYYGQTPNIFYTLLGVVALVLAVGIIALGVVP